jgi:hypothetical protein
VRRGAGVARIVGRLMTLNRRIHLHRLKVAPKLPATGSKVVISRKVGKTGSIGDICYQFPTSELGLTVGDRPEVRQKRYVVFDPFFAFSLTWLRIVRNWIDPAVVLK